MSYEYTISNVLEEAGIPYKQNARSFILDCPKCGKKDKVWIEKEDGYFVCWVCADEFKGSNPAYVLHVLTGKPIHELKDLFDGMSSPRPLLWVNRDDDAISNLAFQDAPPKPFVMPPEMIPISSSDAVPGRLYLVGRGIPALVAEEYGIRFWPRYRRIIFPILVDGVCYGYQARMIDPAGPGDIKILSSKDLPRRSMVMFHHRLKDSPHAVICEGPVDAIKCFGKDTRILMYDGSIKRIQDIQKNDELMGPDSCPRKVLATSHGEGKLYRVTPRAGGSEWVCNEQHILSLRGAQSFPDYNKITNISMGEYIIKSKNFKNGHRLWRASIDWPEQKLDMPPYVLGIWLGDGDSNRACLTSMDTPIADEWTRWVVSNDDSVYITKTKGKGSKARRFFARPGWISESVSVSTDSGPRHFHVRSNALLESLGVRNNKHIPSSYLFSSRQQRLELLAGILDTDGTWVAKHHEFIVVSKWKSLACQYAFLARSLGFKVSERVAYQTIQSGPTPYYAICIRGDVGQIPTKLSRKRGSKATRDADKTMFDVEPIGCGEFYGVEIDGDRLFLLDDFTVVHNCHLIGGNVATMGKYVTPQQIQQIRATGVKKIYFALDRDALPGVPNLARECGLEAFVIRVPDGREDMGDCTPLEVLQQFRLATPVNGNDLFTYWPNNDPKHKKGS